MAREHTIERSVRATPDEWAQIDVVIDCLVRPGCPRSAGMITAFLMLDALHKQAKVPVQWGYSAGTVPASRPHSGGTFAGTDVALSPDPDPSVSSPSREEGGCKGGPAAEVPIPSPVKSPTLPGGQVALPLDDVQEFTFTLWAGTQPFDSLKDPAELYARLRLARPDLDVIEQTHRIALWWATHPKQQRKNVARFIAGWFANEGRQRPRAARPSREQARLAEIEHARSLTPEEQAAEYHAMCERAGISH